MGFGSCVIICGPFLGFVIRQVTSDSKWGKRWATGRTKTLSRCGQDTASIHGVHALLTDILHPQSKGLLTQSAFFSLPVLHIP